MSGPADTVPRSGARRYVAPVATLLTTTLGNVLVFGSASALAVALPSMSADLSAPAATADWFLLAFILANTASILIFGAISDTWGRRRLYLGGLLLFTLASALCTVAPDSASLIALRTVQGIAAACAVSNSSAVLADVFQGRHLSTALSVNILGGAISMIIAPAIGGVLVDQWGWRSLFVVLVPLGLVALALAYVGLRTVHSAGRHRARYDIGGALLSVCGLAFLLIGVNRLPVWGYADWRVWALIVGGIVLILAFALVESRVSAPLVAPEVVRGARGTVYASTFFISFAFTSIVVLVVLRLQLVNGLDAANAGLAVMPLGIGILIGANLGAILLRRRDTWPVLVISSAAITAGLVVLSLAFIPALGAAEWPLMLSGMVVVGAGEGTFMCAAITRIMSGVAPNRRAIANGFRSVLHNGSMALSTAVILLVVGSGANTSYAELGGVTDPLAFVFAAAVLAVSAMIGSILAVRSRRGRSASRPEVRSRRRSGRFSRRRRRASDQNTRIEVP